MTCFQDFGFIPFPKNLSNTAMASSDSNDSIRTVSDGDISSECSSGGDYGIVNMGANLPYQDEPLTISDRTFNFEKAEMESHEMFWKPGLRIQSRLQTGMFSLNFSTFLNYS